MRRGKLGEAMLNAAREMPLPQPKDIVVIACFRNFLHCDRVERFLVHQHNQGVAQGGMGAQNARVRLSSISATFPDRRLLFVQF